MRVAKKNHGSMLVILLLLGILLVPQSSFACNPKSHAKTYIDQIHAILGGDKPDLEVEDGNDGDVVAFYDRSEEIIHIYEDDYNGLCEDNLPYLRSVIAHEYSHHLTTRLKNIALITGRENIANVGEHAIADAVWGADRVVYDDILDPQFSSQYDKIFSFIINKIEKQKSRP